MCICCYQGQLSLCCVYHRSYLYFVKMTDQLKNIVQELNKEPFNRNYNLISFDSLDSNDLLQELNDVICIVEGTPPVDIRHEGSDETALRIFNSLRIMKFKPPQDPDELSAFRQGVVEGEKQAIYSILEWVLPRVPELQERAYLAKYLVRVEVPGEFQQDPDVDQIKAEVEQLMEEFKGVHQEALAMRSEGLVVDDIRQDLQTMEQEREQITRRIDRVKKRADTAPQREKMIQMASNLRSEKERESQLASQKQEQRNGLVHAEQKIQRLQQQLREVKQQAESIRPEDMIVKLEEENKIHTYMVTEKLPKEIANKRKTVQEMQKVASLPAMDKNDLDEVKQKIDETNEEIVKLTDKRDSLSDAGEEKLSIFRHQANMVERKKEKAAEKLQETRIDLSRIETELREKRDQMRDSQGNEIVTSIQFKNYVNKLRTKTNMYKKKRAELQDLRAEIGVQARTEEILKGQMEQLKESIEATGGTLLPAEDIPSKPQRPKTAKPQSKDVEELKAMVTQMENKVTDRKAEFGPLVNELRPLRETYQNICDQYLNAKQQYDTTAASLESGYSRLEQDVKSIRTDVNKADSEYFKIDVEKKIVETHTSRVGQEDSNGSFSTLLENRIREAEVEGNKYKDEQANIKTDQQDAARQMKLWRDFNRIMECKKRCFLQKLPATTNNERWSAGTGHRGGGSSDGPPTNQQALRRPPSRIGNSMASMPHGGDY